MKLLIASNNKHKIREIKEILGGHFDTILSMAEAGIDLEVVEDGTTFAENAMKKARETLAAAEGVDAVLSDDSGLMVDALGGAPGVYSARYAGEGHDDEANNRKLLEAMKDVKEGERGCRFVSAIALVRKDAPALVTEGYVEGQLLYEARGENGFGYDPLFYYAPFRKSFAELSAEEKNSVSHRKNALNALEEKLRAEKSL